MKKVFIIHGFGGSPNGGWRPYVMRELEKKDIYACSLAMPNQDSPKLSEWLDELNHQISLNVHDEIYLVGHSLGGTLILRYLEQPISPTIKGAVLVSAPCRQNANEKIKDFLSTEFNWSEMKNKIPINVIHGDNDPNVPVDDATQIQTELGGKLLLIPRGGHLNGSSGFTELPEVVSELIELIK